MAVSSRSHPVTTTQVSAVSFQFYNEDEVSLYQQPHSCEIWQPGSSSDLQCQHRAMIWAAVRKALLSEALLCRTASTKCKFHLNNVVCTCRCERSVSRSSRVPWQRMRWATSWLEAFMTLPWDHWRNSICKHVLATAFRTCKLLYQSWAQQLFLHKHLWPLSVLPSLCNHTAADTAPSPAACRCSLQCSRVCSNSGVQPVASGNCSALVTLGTWSLLCHCTIHWSSGRHTCAGVRSLAGP